MKGKYGEVKFNFFDFWFKPYTDKSKPQSSKQIIKDCIDEINRIKLDEGNAIVIDRHEGRMKDESRALFVSSAAYNHTEKKYKCRIALIRDDKNPIFVNKEDFSITSLETLKNHVMAETTNFYIDMSTDMPVVCCEFSNVGPRILDIEYYFRQIAFKQLTIATGCRAKVHMKMPVNEVLDSLTNVLKFEIKARPNRLAYLNKEVNDAFVANMSALANTVDPSYMRVEANFRKRGNTQQKKNNKAISFIKRALKAIKADNNIVEDFDDFTLEFERADESEGEFNLIHGKQQIDINCPYKTQGNYDTIVMYELVKDKFDNYLSQRNN